MSKITHYLILLSAIAGTIYAVSIAQSFIVPIIWSIIIWYFIITLSTEIYKISWFKKIFPFWVSSCISIGIFIFLFMLIGDLIESSINDVIKALPNYQDRLLIVIQSVSFQFGIEEPKSLESIIKSINLTPLFSSFGNIFKSGIGSLGIILIYVLFLLLEYHTFEKKLQYIIPNKKKREKVLDFFHIITRELKTYLKIKSISSCATGGVSFIVLSSIGVDFASFWALFIFLLNYIPTVGSIIAVTFPIVVSLVQFDGFGYFGLTAVLLIAVQIIIGNILEPRFMGKSLNLSPFVIILSLSIWGKILGLTGMFLCVPIMVVLNLILSNFESTRPIAIILSANGKIIEKKKKNYKLKN